MRIVFVCGSAEPGKDGVGDYTRRLAGELQKKACQVSIIALNDPFVNKPQTENQPEVEQIIKTTRLPLSFSWESKSKLAIQCIEVEKPDWISLQYVPFSFHPKGLPFWLGRYISFLKSNYRFHVMFHELWVGMSRESSVKDKIWGGIQKQLIQSFLRRTKPRLISTQTHLYQRQLHTLGFTARHLPIFSNIPVAKCAKLKDNNLIQFVLFGSIHSNAPIESFIEEVIQFANDNNKKARLFFVGRSGGEQEKWTQAWSAAGLTYEIKGELPADEISAILSASDYGICTTAFWIIEKSGSFAAMKAHGLPVICVAKKWAPDLKNYKLNSDDINAFPYEKGNLRIFLAQKDSFTKDNDNTVELIASSLLNSFTDLTR